MLVFFLQNINREDIKIILIAIDIIFTSNFFSRDNFLVASAMYLYMRLTNDFVIVNKIILFAILTLMYL